MTLCRVAYLTPDGRRVTLTTAERDRLLFADPKVRREVRKASKQFGSQGCLILLDEPVLLHHSAPQSIRK
jgi:hypothetical protein